MMINIGDKIKLNWISSTRSNKNEWTEFEGEVAAITRFAIILQKDNGIRESFNFPQLTCRNIRVMKRINKKYEVLNCEDIRKQFRRWVKTMDPITKILYIIILFILSVVVILIDIENMKKSTKIFIKSAIIIEIFLLGILIAMK